MKKDEASAQDRIIPEPGSEDDIKQQIKDAKSRLIDTGLGGTGTYPWGSLYMED